AMPSSSLSSILPPNAASTSSIYTLSLHDALPILPTGSAFPVLIKCGLQQLQDGKNGCGAHCSQHLVLERQDLFIMVDLIQKHTRSEEHTSELQSRFDLVCRLLLEKKKKNANINSR